MCHFSYELVIRIATQTIFLLESGQKSNQYLYITSTFLQSHELDHFSEQKMFPDQVHKLSSMRFKGDLVRTVG